MQSVAISLKFTSCLIYASITRSIKKPVAVKSPDSILQPSPSAGPTPSPGPEVFRMVSGFWRLYGGHKKPSGPRKGWAVTTDLPETFQEQCLN